MSTQRIPGSFRHTYRTPAVDGLSDPLGIYSRRVGRILASIQQDIDEGGHAYVRQILRGPRELFRLELERSDLAYQRTTILDRETLDALIEQTPEETLRERFLFSY